jgi:mannose-6-phosphate isomerase-like protein (cupin superfamily)
MPGSLPETAPARFPGAEAAGIDWRGDAGGHALPLFVKRRSVKPIDFAGLEITDFTAGKEVRSSVAWIDVPSGARHAEAWSRRSDKYYVVVAGVLHFEVEGIEFNATPGDFVLVRQGERFRYRNDRREPATLVLVHTPSFDVASEVIVGDS